MCDKGRYIWLSNRNLVMGSGSIRIESSEIA